MADRDRATFSLLTSNVQTRSFRSNSFNPPPPLGSHRSRRTLSLPAREKPIIPPPISENPECSQLDGEEQHNEDELQEQQQQQQQQKQQKQQQQVITSDYEIGR